jgi:hypothetical protein
MRKEGVLGRDVRVGEEFVVCCTVIFIPGIGSLIEHITHAHTHARTHLLTKHIHTILRTYRHIFHNPSTRNIKPQSTPNPGYPVVHLLLTSVSQTKEKVPLHANYMSITARGSTSTPKVPIPAALEAAFRPPR